MIEASNLGRFIHQCRTDQKLTARRVESLVKERGDLPRISESHLLQIEKGRHFPRLDTCIAIAEVLSVPVNSLIEHCRRDIGAKADRPPPGTSWDALVRSAHKCMPNGDFHTALMFLRQATALLAEGETPIAEATAAMAEIRLTMAECYRATGNLVGARDELLMVLRDESLAPALMRRALLNLTSIYRRMSDSVPARASAKMALELAEEAGDLVHQARATHCLGSLALERRVYPEALRRFREAVNLFRKAGDERGAVITSLSAAVVSIEKRDYQIAIDSLKGLLVDITKLGDQKRLAEAHCALGKALYRFGNRRGGMRHAELAKQLADRGGYQHVLFMSLYYLWRIARDEKRPQLAAIHEKRLREVRRKLDDPLVEVTAFDREVDRRQDR